MRFKNTLILLGVAILLFAFVYAYEFRKPKEKNNNKILQIEAENITRIELAYTEPQSINLTCFKDNKGQWRVEKPSNVKADHNAISNLIKNTISRSIFNTLKDTGNPAEYGFDRPRVTATFHLHDGTYRKLLLGNTVPVGNYIYVKTDSSPDISIVPASIIGDFTKLISEPGKEQVESEKGNQLEDK